MKSTSSLLFVVFLLCSQLQLSCDTKQNPPSLEYGSITATDTVVEEAGKSAAGLPQKQTLPDEIYSIWTYDPQIITIPAQVTMESAVCNMSSNMRQCYNYDHIGGIKLIGEMSADKAGYNYSSFPYPIELNILSLDQLHLGFITSCCNPVCLAVRGDIKVLSSKISGGFSGMRLEVVLKNESQSNQEVVFEQGQMIEVNELHAQNVVIVSGNTIQIGPNESRSITLTVFCASRHRNPPTGYSARLTPFIMKAPVSTFQSQQRVWDLLESDNDPNDYVTFYVWGKGAVTESGVSLFGHAFVRIPQVGVFGFSSLHGSFLNDEGSIFDHTSSVKYATDSCRIKVSDEAKKAIINKLHQLQQDVPRYRGGRYDCTSFVMDIADAGGIHYGLRVSIHSPVGFMQELKKHNYSY